jgi:acetyl-CoA carboxylase carboxyltransferase component
LDRTEDLRSPITGTVVAITAQIGAAVSAGDTVCVVESMKLEHLVTTHVSGAILRLGIRVGDIVSEGEILASVDVSASSDAAPSDRATPVVLPHPDIDELYDRRIVVSDDGRPDAVARMHDAGKLTAREKVSLLLDGNDAFEYGAFAIAAQRARRPLEHLITHTPADGLVTVVGSINADLFASEDSLAAVLAYDTTVLAGTQGVQNHRKTDRLLDIAAQRSLPIVLFADGGGGRPGDTETVGRSGLDVPTFASLARLSGAVPLVAIVSGYCFAGNAILAGMCDVIIATSGAHIGAGGPAMIEGGGLGTVSPDEIGPPDMHAATGVIDVLVEDDAAAVATARMYVGFFQGRVGSWQHADQSTLRMSIPREQRRAYDVRSIIETISDADSVLELKRAYGRAMITSLARVEGSPIGILANDPMHTGGAIDAAAADKGRHFLELCASFDIPVVSFIDTPGIMVGADAEREATVHHASRLFVAGAQTGTRLMAVVTRRGYGLGAMAMAGGGFKETTFTVAWPSATIGPMGLEGAVTLGYRRELDAITDDAARQERYNELVAAAYDDGKAINAATWYDIDEVIDPADTRKWIAAFLRT